MWRSRPGRLRNVFAPSPKSMPWNLLPDSITRGSSCDVRRWTMSRSPIVSAIRCAIWLPRSDRWNPSIRPYRTPPGLWTSPCRSRWTMVWTPMSVTSRRSGRGRGGRQGIDDGGQGPVVVRRGDEPRLVRRRGQVDALVEHRVEERGVGAGVLLARPGEVADRAVAEEHREHGAGGLDDVRDAGRLEVLGGGGADRLRGGVELRVDVGRREPQGGEAGRRGDRVPRERASLVDGALGREVGHQVGATAEGRGRESAAHHLPKVIRSGVQP